MTPATLTDPRVSTRTLLRLLAPALAAHGIADTCDRAQIGQRTLARWRTGEIPWATFDTADRVITDVLDEPGLWRTDPELAAVYAELER